MKIAAVEVFTLTYLFVLSFAALIADHLILTGATMTVWVLLATIIAYEETFPRYETTDEADTGLPMRQRRPF